MNHRAHPGVQSAQAILLVGVACMAACDANRRTHADPAPVHSSIPSSWPSAPPRMASVFRRQAKGCELVVTSRAGAASHEVLPCPTELAVDGFIRYAGAACFLSNPNQPERPVGCPAPMVSALEALERQTP